jgi:hypothetical protein
MGVRNEFGSDLDKGTSSLWHLICPLLPPLRPYAHTVLNVRHHAASTKFPTLGSFFLIERRNESFSLIWRHGRDLGCSEVVDAVISHECSDALLKGRSSGCEHSAHAHTH